MTPEEILQRLQWGQFGDATDDKAVDEAFGLIVAWYKTQASADDPDQLMSDTEANQAAAKFLEASGYSAPGRFPEEVAPEQPWYDPEDAVMRERLAAEAAPVQYYQRFMARQPMQQFAGGTRRFIEGLGREAWASYTTGRQGMGEPGSEAQTFREYLNTSGRPIQTPEQMLNRIQRIGELQGQSGPLPAEDEAILNRLQELSPDQIFSLAWGPRAAQLSPILREGHTRMARGRFEQQREQTPDIPFLKYLAGRQGNWFSGPVIPAGQPTYG
jgi:hypothetical protein